MRVMANPHGLAARLDQPALNLCFQPAKRGFNGRLDSRQVVRMHGGQKTARFVIETLQITTHQAFAGRADIEQLSRGGIAAVKNVLYVFDELAKARLAGMQRSLGLLKRLIGRSFFHHSRKLNGIAP